MRQDEVFHSNPKMVGGTAVFVGTRVPVRTLLDYIEEGDSLEAFLEDFPGVRYEQAVWFLEHGRAGEPAEHHQQDSSPEKADTDA